MRGREAFALAFDGKVQRPATMPPQITVGAFANAPPAGTHLLSAVLRKSPPMAKEAGLEAPFAVSTQRAKAVCAAPPWVLPQLTSFTVRAYRTSVKPLYRRVLARATRK